MVYYKNMSKSDTLESAWQKAKAYPKKVSFAEITRLCGSSDGRDRLLGLLLMRREIGRGAPTAKYFPIAKHMITDSNNKCRWQALIVIGECIESCPDEVWKIVQEYGDAKDDDLRTAIGVVLLEHLLEFNFDKFFPLVREEVSQGKIRFLDTLQRCFLSDDNYREQKKKMVNYLRNATRGLANKESRSG